MWIYFILIMIILIQGFVCSLIYSKQRQNEVWTLYCILVSIQLFIVSGLRDSSIGCDTRSYIGLFEQIDLLGNSVWDLYYEKGYLLLNILLYKVIQHPQVILIVSSLFTLVSFCILIKNNSKYKWLSFYLFINLTFYYNSMNVLRQYIAMGIVILGYRFVKERKFIKYFSVVMIATLFHSAAILTLIMYIFPIIVLKSKHIILFLSLVFVYLGFDKIINIIFTIFPQYQAHEVYFDSNNLASIILALIYLGVLIVGIICLNRGIIFKKNYMKCIIDRINNMNKDDKIMFYNILIASVIMIFSVRMSILNRVAEYFSVFSIIYIPNCIAMIRNRNNRIYTFLIIMIISMLYNIIVLIYRPEWHMVTPYRWFIQ